jgi:hypothetical protein
MKDIIQPDSIFFLPKPNSNLNRQTNTKISCSDTQVSTSLQAIKQVWFFAEKRTFLIFFTLTSMTLYVVGF